MKILVVGSGAREHALVWKFRQSALADVAVWPGNPAMADSAVIWDLPKSASHDQLLERCKTEGVDLVCVGPEAPLESGLIDVLQAGGIRAFGPTAAAAKLEASKAFSKSIMERAGIPTARHTVVRNRSECRAIAMKWLQEHGGVVLKASGLAAGKGVFVCEDAAAIDNGLHHLYDTEMSAAAAEVVIEELLRGREVSHFSLVGPHSAVTLGFAVDHKRLRDGDLGPNTGGMGCYTPVPWLPADADEMIRTRVVQPLLATMRAIGCPYQGFLYTGLMWTDDGPYVIEFNVRLGDPEAQALAVNDDREWLSLILDVLADRPMTLASTAPVTQGSLPSTSTVCVVVAAEGYPYDKPTAGGREFTAQEFGGVAGGPVVFAASLQPGAGTELRSGSGRVLSVVARGRGLAEARQQAYQHVEQIVGKWPGAQFRLDIGLAALTTTGGT